MRKIDNLGRYVIAKEFRTALGIEIHDALECYVDGDKIIIKKHQPGCYVCDSEEEKFIHLYGRNICEKCIQEISDAAEKITAEVIK
ncbi:AbrB/MazE/SpoVT family DNA-binding domain-containing protein [Cryptosporangium minutisporangium]|uniref:AbrB/MazE/SpoVT family DNA-binding domain-containing protein n=1 Tax=Cryptosporangium minutisporangium TaxID=113569 RepID=UPI0035F01FD8